MIKLFHIIYQAHYSAHRFIIISGELSENSLKPFLSDFYEKITKKNIEIVLMDTKYPQFGGICICIYFLVKNKDFVYIKRLLYCQKRRHISWKESNSSLDRFSIKRIWIVWRYKSYWIGWVSNLTNADQIYISLNFSSRNDLC